MGHRVLALAPRHPLPRRPVPGPYPVRATGHGHPKEPRRRSPAPGRTPRHHRSHPMGQPQHGPALHHSRIHIMILKRPCRQNPFVQSASMFITHLFAASVPVIPFVFFTLATARIVSLSVTFTLLVLLGVGRSMIGHRRLLATVAETIVIAAAAAGPVLAVGHPVS